jgi:hypothetical protein
VQESSPRVMAKRPLQSSVKWFWHALTCILGKVLLYNPDYLFGRRCFWRENRSFPPFKVKSTLKFSMEEKRETKPFCFAFAGSAG